VSAEGGGQSGAAAGAGEMSADKKGEMGADKKGEMGADKKGEMGADISRLLILLSGTEIDFSLFRAWRQPHEEGGLWVYGSRSVVHSKVPHVDGLQRGVMLVWAVWRGGWQVGGKEGRTLGGGGEIAIEGLREG